MSYREKAADQASYLNAVDYNNTGLLAVEIAQGVIWALLAVAEAVADHE
jgi:hypothetical protein